MEPRKIIGVSDVSIGYGSPIIPSFMESLKGRYREADVELIEPDQPEAPPRHSQYPRLSIRRICTTFHPHNHLAGRIEYIYRAAERVNSVAPDILVVFCAYSVPLLFKLLRKPPFVIYYAVEMTSSYYPLDVEMGRHIEPLVDLIIYPEENRQVLEAKLCGIGNVPSLVLLNCTNPADADISSSVPATQRNGRILYSGTIDLEQTCFDHLLRRELCQAPIDLYGKPSGNQKDQTARMLNQIRGALRYLGYVDGRTLAELRKHYGFSMVVWRPLDDNHYYAAPNKFFEAIASGVPPITAPHPQCKEIANRYECGVVMEDWSFESFREGIQKALKIFGTKAYGKMVENCFLAVRNECNWGLQFEKVLPYLP